MDETIHIIGGGIGGLTLGLALLQQGQSVVIYEQAPELGEVGAGLSISPNASKALGYIGMLPFMNEMSNVPQTNFVFHGITNEELVAIDRTTDLDRFGAAYYQIHRADFHSELVGRIQDIDKNSIKLNHQLSDIKTVDDGAEMTFSNGQTVMAKVVIGADGIRSIVRDKVFRDSHPEFTGVMAWRALIPKDDVSDLFTDPVSRVWTGPGRTFVTYPIRHKALVNVVCFAQAESWVEEGWSVKAERSEMLTAFEDYCDPVQELVSATPEDTLYRWGLFARRPLDTLVHENIGLIGDAAHPMLPWFGQGASSSIEDGVILARCFDQCKTAPEALQLYNKMRHARVSFLQAESNKGTERMQSADPYALRDAPRQDEDALGIFKFNPATAELA